MDRSDIPIIMILLLAAVVFGAVCAFYVPPFTSHATSEEIPLVETPSPNQILGLDVSLSDYQVFINYTPEPGAKVMRVEYIRRNGYHGEGTAGAFDFPVNATLVSTTFQRDDFGYPSKMRVTIIYDNNIVKYVEFQT